METFHNKSGLSTTTTFQCQSTEMITSNRWWTVHGTSRTIELQQKDGEDNTDNDYYEDQIEIKTRLRKDTIYSYET